MPLCQYSCRRCKEGPRIDKCLYKCVGCKRYYHSACHRPPPHAENWTCQKCLAPENLQNNQRRRRYHDTASTSSYATSLSSSSLHQANPDTAMSGPGGSFTPDSNDADVVVVQCSFPQCTAEPMANGPLCATHMMDMTKCSPASKSALGQSALGRQSSHVNPKARLNQEHDPNGVLPILRRKTGSSGHPPKPQPAADFRSVPKPTASPTSHKVPPQRQNIRSPPVSPKREAGPQRKKIRLAQDLEEAGLQRSRPLKPMPGEVTGEDRPKQPRDRNGNLYAASSQTSANGSRYGQRIGTAGKDATKRLSRPHVIRKTAAQPFVFNVAPVKPSRLQNGHPHARTGSNRHLDSEMPDVNEITMNDAEASPESNQTEAGDFVGNKALRAWFSERRSTGPVNHPDQRNDQRNDEALEAPASKPVNGHLRQGDEAKVLGRISKSTTAGAGGKRQSQEIPQLSPRIPMAAKPTKKPPRREVPKLPHKMDEPKVQPISKIIDEPSFDALIYRQAGASAPPAGVRIPKLEAPPKSQSRDEPYYAHIDPRLHWPQHHSERWRKAKQEEIQARGGRKANFGGAVVRMREQRLREGAASFADQLPDRIREDPAWVRALAALQETENKRAAGEKTGTRQGLKRQPSTNDGTGIPRK